MKKITFIWLISLLPFFSPLCWAKSPGTLVYEVNLNDRGDDQFKVTLRVKGLKPENAIYQFASTAPGTYQIMDIGRYVRSFQAFDKKGKELKTEKISTNQWKLEDPERVREIRYSIAETWDTPVNEHRIYGMCGTSVEKDHVLINGQGVFGFPTGMQQTPLEVKVDYPSDWEVGTALDKNSKGYYQARSYDHMVDSPILLGRLTKAQTTVAGAQIEVYTYSKTDQIKSEQLLSNMQTMLNAAGSFLKQLPVKRYAFLYHFEDQSWGAWEHSYSSEYVMREQPFSKPYADLLTSIAAHEFFHIVTPLNIHSEIIQQFNFVNPTPSEHLWLYEGVTEWASHIMQLRAGMIDLNTYLERLSGKVSVDKSLDTTYSLSKLGLTCYTDEGQKQYINIYNRGALTASLLDIRLLELSNGTKGLREVINELATTFGPDKAFPEKEFFTLFVQKTYPEIGDFINRYIKNAEPLPYAEYYQKLGITYTPAVTTGKKVPFTGIQLRVAEGKLVVVKLEEMAAKAGLREKDAVVRFNQQVVTANNAQSIGGQINALKAGDTYTLTVLRDNKEITVPCRIEEKAEVKNYVFQPNPQATPQQMQLRSSWLKNL
jgi:predicted metalloprotease with PDZ domain